MTKNIILVLLFLGVFTTLMSRSQGNESGNLTVSEVLSMYKSGSIEFIKHPCEYQYEETETNLKEYKAKFWCPGWANFTGESLSMTKSGAVGLAMRDFAQKAVDSKLVTKSRVKNWI